MSINSDEQTINFAALPRFQVSPRVRDMAVKMSYSDSNFMTVPFKLMVWDDCSNENDQDILLYSE